MPLYELLMIAKYSPKSSVINGITEKKALHDLFKKCATHVLDNQGVVRQFQFLGFKNLPYRMKRHQEIFSQGSYLVMKFDSSPNVMTQLSKNLKLDETVIRHSILNFGNSLQEITGFVQPEKIKN